ncbi:MAG: TonB-dependent receptor [Bacteroidota bacterium]
MCIPTVFKNIFSLYFLAIATLTLGSTHPLTAAEGIVAGIVQDSKTKAPLSGITLRIEGTALGGSTDREGKFILHSVPPGRYILLSSAVGYRITKTDFTLQDQDSVFLNVEITPVYLQESELIVSAGKRVQAVHDVPVSVVVVDERAIRQRNITKIDDLLRYIPGVSVSGNQVSIRGTSGFTLGFGSRTLMLLDGFPMLSADIGDIKFDALPLFDIERVEVVKGASSALYGNAALGGIISFITREPREYPEFRFRSYEGIYTVPKYDGWRHTQQLSRMDGFDASYSQKIGPVSWIFSGGIKGDNSYRAFDDSYRWNVFSKISFVPAPSTSIFVLANHAYEDHANWSYWRNLKNATLPPEGTDMSERLRGFKTTLVGEFKQIISNAHYFIIRGGSYITEFQNNVGLASQSFQKSRALANNIELQANSRYNEKILFTYGGAFIRNDVLSNIYADNSGLFLSKGQYISSGYAQTEFTNLDGIIVTLGSRLDAEKTFGEKSNIQFSPRFGMSYASPIGAKLRISAGRGFRAPSVGERSVVMQLQNFKLFSNSDISPEKSWSFELGANHNINILDAPFTYDIALFQNELYSLIEPVFTGNDKIQFRNATRARVQGIEIGIKGWLLKERVGIESSVMAMYPKDITLQEPLKYRPNVQWQSHILMPVGAVEFHADYRFQSRVEKIDENFILLNFPKNADSRVAIHVLDIRAVLDFKKINQIPISLTLNAKNLLDYYYTEVIGNLAPTRSFSLQFDTKF